jgi:hypothetical protein
MLIPSNADMKTQFLKVKLGGIDMTIIPNAQTIARRRLFE